MFVRVENDGDKASRAATELRRSPTRRATFRPVRWARTTCSPTAAARAAAQGIIPAPDSPPGQGSIQGSLLLFRIPTRNLENRPLELVDPAAQGRSAHATVDLDV